MKDIRCLLALMITLLNLSGCAGRSGVASATGVALGVATGDSAVQGLASYSPEEIKKFISANGDVNLNPIWNFYGIKAEPFERYNQPYVSYEAEIFPIALYQEATEDALLRISLGSSYRFLIFKGLDKDGGGGSGAWKYLGFVDIDGQQYGPPEHQIMIGDRVRWLSLKELWGRGTGVSRYGLKWYEINGDGKELRAVLGFPVKGHQFTCEPYSARSFSSKIIEQGTAGGSYEVKVEFSVSYDFEDCHRRNGSEPKSLELFSKTQTATYVWNSQAHKFVLAKSKSELSDDEIDAVYNFDSLDEDEFLEYNFEELKTLASRGNAEQKEWLNLYLSDLPDSKRKRTLGKTLTQ
ncbi:MAG TPA: hypothetical protein VIQ24_21825 [Pyrinomonadaceae bacterium]